MADCDFCNFIKGKMNKVYEDSQIYVMHAPKPATFGHLIVLPKEHAMIIEQIPDFVVAEIFEKVNKVSTAVFESIGAQGTNIIVQNGVAAGQGHSHFMIHVIPRREKDGLDFNWEPKHLSEEEMSTVELKIKEAAKDIGAFEQKPAKPVILDKKTEKIKEGKKGDEVNYLIKQLERIP